jgi:hypothetical protein
MKKLIFCVAFSLMVISPCLADDPNNPVTINYNSCEARIKELEDKIIELENRIAELESKRPAMPARGPGPTSYTSPGLTSSTDNDPNLRIERCTKVAQESLALITLYEIQLYKLLICYHLPLPDVNELKNLPHYYYYYYYYRYRLGCQPLVGDLDDESNWAIDNIELLGVIEREYKKIQNNREYRNPKLKIDCDDISKRLTELSSEILGFDKLRQALRNRMEPGHILLRSKCYESINKRSVRVNY